MDELQQISKNDLIFAAKYQSLKNTILNILKFLAFVGIGVTILYLVYQSQQASYEAKCALDGIPMEDCVLLDKVIADFRSANPWWLLLALIAFSLSNLSRAIRWGMLLEPLSHKPRLINTFLTVIINYVANLALPRMGEIVRGATLARYEQIPVEKVMGTIVVDRIMDVIYLILFVGLALLLELDVILNFFSQNAGDGEDSGGLLQNPLIQGIGALGIVTLAIVALFHKQIRNSKLYAKVLEILKGFLEGLQTIRQLDRPWLFIFHSTNVWAMYFIMNYFCILSFAPTADLTPLAALMVFVFGAFGIVIPSPGGMGTYHWLAIQALALYGIESSDAFSFANISFFLIQIFYNITFGLLAFLLIGRINKGYAPAKTLKSD